MINKLSQFKIFIVVFFSFIFLNACPAKLQAQNFAYNTPSTVSSIPFYGQVFNFEVSANTYSAVIDKTTFVSIDGNYDSKITSFSPSNNEGKTFINLAPYNFSFIYNNTTYSSFYITTNGYLNLSGSEYAYSSDPSISGFSNNINEDIIAPSWTDLSIKYVTTKMIGSKGTRVLTIEYTCYNAVADIKFQVKLYENSSTLKFIYGDYFFKPNPNFGALTTNQLSVGLQFKGSSSPTNYALDAFSVTPLQFTPATVIGNADYPYVGIPTGPSAISTLSQGKIGFLYYGKGMTNYPTSSTPPINVGTYAVIANVNSDDTYFGQSTEEFPFSIIKAEPNITITGAPIYTYIGSPQGPVVTTSISDGIKTYVYSGTGTTTYQASSSRPTEVGTYQLVASITETNNYIADNSDPYNFTIANYSNSLLTASSISFTGNKLNIFDGFQHTPTANIIGSTATPTYYYAGTGSTNYDITTVAPSNVGNYELVVFVESDLNYYGLTSDALSFTISLASSAITVTGATSYNYKGRPQGPNNYTKVGSTTTPITYIYSGTASTTFGPSSTAPIEIGSYQVVATVNADHNYDLANSIPFVFTIVKAPSTISVTGLTSYTYNGTAQGPTTASINGSTATPTYLYSGIGSTVYQSTPTRPINIGTYQVVASINEDTNYLSKSSAPLNFIINNLLSSTITVTGSSSYTANGTEQGPSTSLVNGSTATPTYTYRGVSPTIYSSSSTKPSAAGTYQVIASVNADVNFNAASSPAFQFSIVGPSFPFIWGDGDFNYTTIPLYIDDFDNLTDGDLVIYLDKNGSTGSAAYVFTGTNTTNYPASKTAPILPGSYTVTATVGADKSHEQASSNALAFNILFNTIEISIDGDSVYDFNGTPLGPSNGIVYYFGVPNNVGTILYEYSGLGGTNYISSSTLPTQAGTYQVVATLQDLIYAGSSLPFKFSILAPSTITVTGTSTFTYDGSAQGPITSSVNGSTASPSYIYSGTDTTIYGPLETPPTNPGTYQVIASVAADAIYKTANSSPFHFVINNSNVSKLTVIGLSAYTYNGNPQGPISCVVNGSTASPTYSYSGVSPTIYGPSNIAPTEIGSYQVIASVMADANFNQGSSDPFTFIINNLLSSTITVTGGIKNIYDGKPFGPNTSEISGSTATPTYSYSGVSPTIYGPITNAPINPGNYIVIASLTADDNYNGAISDPFNFTIYKANSILEYGDKIPAYTYDGFAHGPSLDFLSVTGSTATPTAHYIGVMKTSYDSNELPINAGNYEVTFSVDEDVFYNAQTSDALQFTINTISSSISITGITNYNYNTTAQGPALPDLIINSGPDPVVFIEYTGVGNTNYPVSIVQPILPGNYIAQAFLSGQANYADASSETFGFTIHKGIPTVQIIGSLSYVYRASEQGPIQIQSNSYGIKTITYQGGGVTVYGPSTTRPIEVGSYIAVGTISETQNYNSATTAAFNFSITPDNAGKQPRIITLSGNKSYAFTPSVPHGDNTEIVATITGSSVTPTYTYSGIGITNYPSTTTPPTELGFYELVVTVPSDNFYYEASSSVFQFSIKNNAALSWNSFQEFEYNGQAQGPVGINAINTNSDGIPNFLYTGINSTVYTTTNTMPTNVGEYTASVIIPETDIYLEQTTADLSFTIIKSSHVNIQLKDNVLTLLSYTGDGVGLDANSLDFNEYTGTYSVTYTNNSGSYYNSDQKPTSPGSYFFTISSPGDNNYNAFNSDFSFVITKRTIHPVLGEPGTIVKFRGYHLVDFVADTLSGKISDGESQILLNKEGSTGNVSFLFEGINGTYYPLQSTPPLDYGNYNITASIAEDDNNYAAVSNAYNFKIYDLIFINVTGTVSYTYNGFNQGPDSSNITTDAPITTGNITYLYSGIYSTTYGPTTAKPIDPGNYQVVATVGPLVDDLIFETATSDPFTFIINKATPTISNNGTKKWYYNGLPQGPSSVVKTVGATGLITYAYSGTNSTSYGPSESRPIDPGTYQVVATLGANKFYVSALSEAYPFTIKKVSAITVTGAHAYYYTGTEQGPNTKTKSAKATGVITFTYSGTNSTTYGPSESRPVNPGTYQVVATLGEDSIYYGAISAPYTFVINKVISSINVTGSQNFTYSGTAQGPATNTKTAGTTGAVTYEYSGTISTTYGPSSSAPINAGTYQVVASIAADSFYDSARSAPYTFIIFVSSKPTITITGTSSYVYNSIPQGSFVTTIKGSTATATISYKGTGSSTYGPTIVKPTGPGTYQVIAQLARDSVAFIDSASSTPFAFTITKAGSTIKFSFISGGFYNYSGKPIGPTAYTSTGSTNTKTFNYTGVGSTIYPSSSSLPTNIGAYKAVLNVAEGVYYNGASDSVIFFIKAKSTISLTGSQSYFYTGLQQGVFSVTISGSSKTVSYIYSGKNTTTYTASPNKPIDVGDYSVVASVSSDSFYLAANSDVLNFSILKSKPKITITGDSEYVFRNSATGPNTSNVDVAAGVIKYYYSGIDSTIYATNTKRPTNAGSYKVIAKCSSSSFVDSASSEPFYFTIKKANSNIVLDGTNINIDGGGIYFIPYNGTSQGPDKYILSGSTAKPSFTYYGTGPTVYGPSITPPTNFGYYEVIATVDGDANYYGSNSPAFPFMIDYGASSIDIIADSFFTYNGNNQGPSNINIHSKGSGSAYIFNYYGVDSANYEPSDIAPIDVGNYKLQVLLPHDEYYWGVYSAPFTFSIIKAKTTIQIIGSSIYSYDGTEQGPLTANILGSSATPNFEYEGIDSTVYVLSSQLPKDIGSYKVTASVKEDSHYLSAKSLPYTFRIRPSIVIIDTSITTPIFIDTAIKDPVIKDPVIIDTLKKDTIINVPIVIDSSSIVVVLKIRGNSSIKFLDSTIYTYNGKMQGPNTAKVVGSTGAITYWYNKPPIIAGKYYAIAKVEGDSNFEEAISDTLHFTINPATLTVNPVKAARCFNTANPLLRYTMEGFVNKEDSSVLVNKPIISTGANINSKAGNYSITMDSAIAENYQFKYNTALLTIYPTPIGNVKAGADIVCDESELILKSSGGTKYVWYKNNSVIIGASDSIININSFGNYTNKIISEFGCEAMSTNTLAIKQYYAPTPSFETKYSCVGLPIMVTNKSITNASGLVNYSWEDGAGNTINSIEPNLLYSSIGNKKIQLTITPNACPLLQRKISKEIVVEAPAEAIRMKSVDAIISEPLTLQARNFGQFFAWSIVNKNSISAISLNDSSIYNPILSTNVETELNVAITTANSCVTVDTLLVRIFKEEKIYVPNSFSPNGDGINDEFKINPVGISALYFFRIFDQWGRIVFETNNISIGWDGKLNGVRQPLASYTWMIDASDLHQQRIKQMGVITLIR